MWLPERRELARDAEWLTSLVARLMPDEPEVMGLLALITPAFLIIPMVRYLGMRADRPRVRSAIEGVLPAAAGLLIASTLPLARDAVNGPLPAVIALGSFLALALARWEVGWVLLAAGAAGLLEAVL